MKTKSKRADKVAKGTLRVWWIPQMPMEAFQVPVTTLREARLILNTLAEYDKFQFENNIKPDYCNAGGLSAFDGKEWIDWYDLEGREFDDVPDEELSTATWEEEQ